MKGVQTKVMTGSLHLHPASTKLIGYPSHANNWTELNNLQYGVIQTDIVSWWSFMSLLGECTTFS